MAEPAAEGDGREATLRAMPVSPWALVACLVGYVILSYRFHVVFLNWIVGPLFLLVVLDVIPRGWRLLARAVRSGGAGARAGGATGSDAG